MMINERGREYLGHLSDLIVWTQTSDKLMRKLFPDREYDNAKGDREEYDFILRMTIDE